MTMRALAGLGKAAERMAEGISAVLLCLARADDEQDLRGTGSGR